MLQHAAVAILSFNHPELTARAVRAATNFAHPLPIYLLHNGSEQRHETSLRAQFSTVTHVRLAANAGYSGGCNYLLKNVFATPEIDWVLLLTNDCELTALAGPPTTPGLYAPLIYRRSVDVVDSMGGVFRPWTGRLHHVRSEREAHVRLGQSPRQFHPAHFYVPGTAFWVHRSSWNDLGGFDESLHTYWEDVDLCVRARAGKVTLGVHLSTKVIHGVGKTCHKSPFYTRYLFQRNRKTVSARYSPQLLKWWLWSWR